MTNDEPGCLGIGHFGLDIGHSHNHWSFKKIVYNPRVFDRKDDNQDTPWFGDGLSFNCTQCGNCCTGPSGFVWFDDDEADAMAEFFGIKTQTFLRRYAKRAMGRWTLGEVKNGGGYDCVFLKHSEDGKRTCGIYPVRPTQCRTWPFWPSNVKSRRAWEQSARTCPGMREPDARGENFVPIDKIRVIMAENPEHL